LSRPFCFTWCLKTKLFSSTW